MYFSSRGPHIDFVYAIKLCECYRTRNIKLDWRKTRFHQSVANFDDNLPLRARTFFRFTLVHMRLTGLFSDIVAMNYAKKHAAPLSM